MTRSKTRTYALSAALIATLSLTACGHKIDTQAAAPEAQPVAAQAPEPTTTTEPATTTTTTETTATSAPINSTDGRSPTPAPADAPADAPAPVAAPEPTPEPEPAPEAPAASDLPTSSPFHPAGGLHYLTVPDGNMMNFLYRFSTSFNTACSASIAAVQAAGYRIVFSSCTSNTGTTGSVAYTNGTYAGAASVLGDPRDGSVTTQYMIKPA